jgi:hypothetical protein
LWLDYSPDLLTGDEWDPGPKKEPLRLTWPKRDALQGAKELFPSGESKFSLTSSQAFNYFFFFQFLIPSSKLLTYNEFLELCRWRRDIPRCNWRFLKCGWSLYKGLRLSTYWSNSLGVNFSCHVQTNMSVTRGIIWGISVHRIHKGDPERFSSVYT